MFPILHRECSWQDDDSVPYCVSEAVHRQSNREMRRACLPFSWQSLHAAVARSDRLLPVASWLSCDCCSSFAYEIQHDGAALASAQLCDNDVGSQQCCPRSRYSRL